MHKFVETIQLTHFVFVQYLHKTFLATHYLLWYNFYEKAGNLARIYHFVFWPYRIPAFDDVFLCLSVIINSFLGGIEHELSWRKLLYGS